MATEEEKDRSRQSRVSGSRHTRSKVAPDWTAQQCLTLVNEIAAVEGECRNSLSAFQKWKIIVDNCNAMGVHRSLNQCRLKWDSLLSGYKEIKHWNSLESKVGSYWSLDSELRREYGFPNDFDLEVFDAIDDHLKAADRADTDPDDDPEAAAEEVDEVDVLAESVSKKQRRRRITHQKCSKEKKVKPQKRRTAEKTNVEEKVKPLKHRKKDDKVVLQSSSIEDKEQMMTAKLCENAELITSILKGNLAESENLVLADLKNDEASQTDFTRRQGDQLITCLGNLADTLDQLCDLVQECR